MGIEHYLIDEEARTVLDLHKSYWLSGLDRRENLTKADILAVFDTADSARRCWQPRLRGVIRQWMDEHTTGRVRLVTDSSFDLPFEDERGYLLDTWQGWAAFTWHGMEDEGWTPLLVERFIPEFEKAEGRA